MKPSLTWSLGVALRALRKRRKLRLQDVAAAVKLSASQWSRVELGAQPITTDTMAVAAKFLGVTVVELMKLAEKVRA